MTTSAEVYQFDTTFQVKILALACRDPKFLDLYVDVLDPMYFPMTVHQTLTRMAIHYHSTYHTNPSHEAMREMVAQYCRQFNLDRTSLGELEDSVEKIYRVELSDGDFVRDQMISFGQTQSMKMAIRDAAVQIQKGIDPLKVRNMVDNALRVGMGLGDRGLELFSGLKTFGNLARGADVNTGKVMTGWPTVDNSYYGGPGAGELCILCGGTGQGKSTGLVALTCHAARQGYAALYVTLELSEIDVVTRMIANLTGVEIPKILEEYDSPEFQQAIDELTKYQRYLRVKFLPPKRSSAATIRSYLSRMESQDNVKIRLLVVDYADKLSPTEKAFGSTYIDMGNVYDELTNIAKDFRIPIWTASQLHREGQYKEESGIENISDSYMKAMNADLVLIIQQTREEKKAGIMRGWIDKARRGQDQVGLKWRVRYKVMQVEEQVEHREAASA
jgi:hypothetical protein